MKVSDKGGGDFEQAPIGTHAARSIKLIDIGTQTSDYQGKITHRRQVIVMWELPNTLMTEGENAGKPFIISKFYTASLSEKATLRHDLVSWRGREFTVGELQEFDLKNILGKSCLVSIIHNDNKKARVSGVMALPHGMEVPPQINQTLYFSLDDFDPAVFDGISKGIKEMIEKSPEYQDIVSGGAKPSAKGGDFEDFESDIPF
jgi:hypothetical protein